MPQQRKKEESERLRGERDQIKFIDLGFERWQVVRFRKDIFAPANFFKWQRHKWRFLSKQYNNELKNLVPKKLAEF